MFYSSSVTRKLRTDTIYYQSKIELPFYNLKLNLDLFYFKFSKNLQKNTKIPLPSSVKKERVNRLRIYFTQSG